MKTIHSILSKRRLEFLINFMAKVLVAYFVFLGLLAFAYMFFIVMSAQDLSNSIKSAKSITEDLAKVDINSQHDLIRGMAQGFKMILTWSAVFSLILNIAVITGNYLMHLYDQYLEKRFPRKTKVQVQRTVIKWLFFFCVESLPTFCQSKILIYAGPVSYEK